LAALVNWVLGFNLSSCMALQRESLLFWQLRFLIVLSSVGWEVWRCGLIECLAVVVLADHEHAAPATDDDESEPPV